MSPAPTTSSPLPPRSLQRRSSAKTARAADGHAPAPAAQPEPGRELRSQSRPSSSGALGRQRWSPRLIPHRRWTLGDTATVRQPQGLRCPEVAACCKGAAVGLGAIVPCAISISNGHESRHEPLPPHASTCEASLAPVRPDSQRRLARTRQSALPLGARTESLRDDLAHARMGRPPSVSFAERPTPALPGRNESVRAPPPRCWWSSIALAPETHTSSSPLPCRSRSLERQLGPPVPGQTSVGAANPSRHVLKTTATAAACACAPR